METLALYRLICEEYAKNGRAVSTVDLRKQCKFTDTKFYRMLKTLIGMQFVQRTQRGFVVPIDIYQWHMDDYVGGQNA